MSQSSTKPAKWPVCPVKNQISLGIPLVWSDFTVRMKKPWILSYPLSIQRRLIRLGGCPGWSESSLGAQVILLVLSSSGANWWLCTNCTGWGPFIMNYHVQHELMSRNSRWHRFLCWTSQTKSAAADILERFFIKLCIKILLSTCGKWRLPCGRGSREKLYSSKKSSDEVTFGFLEYPTRFAMVFTCSHGHFYDIDYIKSWFLHQNYLVDPWHTLGK